MGGGSRRRGACPSGRWPAARWTSCRTHARRRFDRFRTPLGGAARVCRYCWVLQSERRIPRPMKPEELIRRYLDDNGGYVDAHLDHLLVTFRFDELSPDAEARIGAALASVGVRVDPPLG